MTSFLAAILAFPTVVFTAVIVFFLLYALLTLLGAFEIDWLDTALGIDHVQDSVLEGALNFLGVSGTPLTIFGGVAAVFAWVTSIVAGKFLPDTLPIDIAVLLGSGALGAVMGRFAVRPLRHLFNAPPAPLRKQIVGKICTIRSLRVDDATGVAEVEDGGSGFIAEVRCFRENELTRGSKAIVYDYDHTEGIYHIGPLDPALFDIDLNGRANAGYDGRQTDIA